MRRRLSTALSAVALDRREGITVETFGFSGHTYQIDRVPTPSWDYYDILEHGRTIGGVRVLAAAAVVGEVARRYVVIGGRSTEVIVEAAIEAGIILVTRIC